MSPLLKPFIQFFTVLLLFLTPCLLHSQINIDKKIDSTGKYIPTVIPVVNIIQRVEEANQDIQTTTRKIKIDNSVRVIDSVFPEYSRFIKAQEKHTDQFIQANPNRQKINNLIDKWNGYSDHLGNWESSINQYEQRNILLKNIIDYNEKTWELSYENAVEQKVPAQVLQSVKMTWNDYGHLNKQMTKENNDLLILESKINNQKLLINKVVDELNELKNSKVYDLFYLRHEPLWKSSFKTPKSKKRDKDDVESLTENVNGISKFLKANESNLYLYVLAVGLLIVLIRFLKGIFQKYPFNEEDGDLQKAKQVMLNQTVVSIIFLALVFANYFFQNGPALFQHILVLLMLIVSVPLVQPFMYKRFKKIVYFIILFFILDTAKAYLWFTSPQYRLYLLIEAFLVIGVLMAFTRPYLETRKMNIGNFGRLLIRMTPVVYLLVLVSIVSNILGYTNLTDLTLMISTQSGVFTIVFYGILMIAGSISIGLIHWHYTRRTEIDHHRKLAIEMKMLKVIRVVAFVFWLLFFLNLIDLLAPITQFFTDAFNDPYKVGSITFTLGDVFTFLLILSVSFLTTSVISFLFESGDVSVKFVKMPKGVPAAISLVIRYLVIGFGIVLALSSLGVDLSKFNLMAGALGLGIGFGLQTVISNFVSGLILVFERPILVGDTVEVSNLLGTVKRIGVRSSSISTFDGAEVVVPNNNLISNDLINWTLSDSIKRIEILVGTAYGSDPNKVLALLLEAANSCEHTLKKPAPYALFSEFGDSSLNFRLRFWAHYEVGLQSKSDVSVAVYNLFEKNGIEIPFPQRDVHIKDLPSSFLGATNSQEKK